MPGLLDLPDELRLHIFEYVFCDLTIKLRARRPKRQAKRKEQHQHTDHDDVTTDNSTAFSIFTVCKALASDPILHKSLRSGATITLDTLADIDSIHRSLDDLRLLSDLQHFSILWKPRSVCHKGRTGKSIDAVIQTLRSKFPATSTLTLRTNPFTVTLQHPTAEDMVFISQYAADNDTSTRYTDDCGNQRDIRHIIYREFHCCKECIQHHVDAVQTGIEINFQLRIRPGYSFGRPGVRAWPCASTMSTRDYILHIQVDDATHFSIPQQPFEDIQRDMNLINNEDEEHDGTEPSSEPKQLESDFFYSCVKVNGMPTRFLKINDGTVVRSYEEGHVWRAG